MTLRLLDVDLDIYAVGADDREEDDPSVSVPAEDITLVGNNRLQLTERIQDWKDVAEFAIDNRTGEYTDQINSGDKIELRVTYAPRLTGQAVGDTGGTHGEDQFGEATFGGGGFGDAERTWVGYAHEPSVFARGADAYGMTFGATDFASEILSDRIAYKSYESTPISGEGGIIDDLVTRFTPELTLINDNPIEQTTDREIDGLDLLEAIASVAAIGDAFVDGDEENVIVEPYAARSPRFTLDYEDFGLITADPEDSTLVNEVRVDGGEGIDIDQQQPNVHEYFRITDSFRMIHLLEPQKSRIDSVDIWTRRDEASQDNLIVRLHRNDRDGNIVGLNDERLAITLRELSQEFISLDGWTRFLMPREPLPSGQIWLVIEAGGETGHDIGANAVGEPAFRSWFPYPISVNVPSFESINKHRRRQHRLKKNNLKTFAAARDEAEAFLRRHQWANRTVEFDAQSVRAHELRTGHSINIDFPKVTPTGEYMVVERSTSFDASDQHMHTNLTLQEVSTL